jgi:RNA polymerase sigma factor (sigma-70 family)
VKRSEKDIEAIFKKYYAYLVLFSIKTVKNKEDAEDIVFHVFSNAIPDFHKYDTEEKIKALLFIACKNASLNHVASKRVKEINSFKYARLICDVYEECDNSKAEVLMKIYAHASTLPEKCQEIFFLSCCKGLRGSKIAEMLDISVNTVFTQRRIAIQSIKKHLKLL